MNTDREKELMAGYAQMTFFIPRDVKTHGEFNPILGM